MPADTRQRITVYFSCPVCGATDIEAKVRCRTQDNPVVQWVEETLSYAMKRAHDAYSPKCKYNHATNVKIPINEDQKGVENWIGKFAEWKNDCPQTPEIKPDETPGHSNSHW